MRPAIGGKYGLEVLYNMISVSVMTAIDTPFSPGLPFRLAMG